MSDKNVASWRDDPGFQALPVEERRGIISRYFDEEYGDDDFRALEPTRQQEVRDQFFTANALEDLIPPPPEPEEPPEPTPVQQPLFDEPELPPAIGTQSDRAVGGAPVDLTVQEKRAKVAGRLTDRLETGTLNTRLGELRYQQIVGNDSEEIRAEIADIKKAMPERYEGETGIVEDFVGAAAEMVPLMATAMREGFKGGLEGAMVGGMAGAVAGNIGAPVTAPAGAGMGYLVGQTHGSAGYIAQAEAGLAYDEMLDMRDEAGNKIDPEIAKGVSLAVGGINGLLEIGQIGILLKTIPGLDKFLSRSINKAVTRAVRDGSLKKVALDAAGGAAKYLAAETSQEVAQESTIILGSYVAAELTDEMNAAGIPEFQQKQILERLGDTAIESLKAFTVLGLPGGAVRTMQTARDMVTDPGDEGKTARELLLDDPLDVEYVEEPSEPVSRETDETIDKSPPEGAEGTPEAPVYEVPPEGPPDEGPPAAAIPDAAEAGPGEGPGGAQPPPSVEATPEETQAAPPDAVDELPPEAEEGARGFTDEELDEAAAEEPEEVPDDAGGLREDQGRADKARDEEESSPGPGGQDLEQPQPDEAGRPTPDRKKAEEIAKYIGIKFDDVQEGNPLNPESKDRYQFTDPETTGTFTVESLDDVEAELSKLRESRQKPVDLGKQGKTDRLGRPTEIDGVKVSTAMVDDIDGVRYELYKPADESTGKGWTIIRDIDSNKVIETRYHPTQRSATDYHIDQISKASKEAKKPEPPAPPEGPGEGWSKVAGAQAWAADADQRLIGRKKDGYEATDMSTGRVIGTYPTAKEAAAAVVEDRKKYDEGKQPGPDVKPEPEIPTVVDDPKRQFGKKDEPARVALHSRLQELRKQAEGADGFPAGTLQAIKIQISNLERGAGQLETFNVIIEEAEEELAKLEKPAKKPKKTVKEAAAEVETLRNYIDAVKTKKRSGIMVERTFDVEGTEVTGRKDASAMLREIDAQLDEYKKLMDCLQ